MTHDEALQLLHAAADGLLGQSERAALEAHLAECDACRARAADLDSLQLNLSHALHARWDVQPLPSDLLRNVLNRARRNGWRQPILRVAGALTAVAALVLLIAFLGALFGGPRTGPGASLTEAVPPATAAPASVGGANGLIAFQSERDGNAEIYVIRADGSGQMNLTNNPAADVAPAWSPDGARLAFISDRSGQQEIYVMNADGSGVIQLTNSLEVTWVPPLSWSPDGTRLVAARAPSFRENWEGVEIYVINADGAGVATVTSDRFYNFSPQWSPDGRRIAFLTLRYALPVLYSINSDGTGLAMLGSGEGRNVVSHAWSPDGSRIAYFLVSVLRHSDYRDEIRILSEDGAQDKVILTLTRPPRSDYEDLAWSPDGTRLLFASSYKEFMANTQQIYLLWADGSGLTRLTSDPERRGASHIQPRWSPNGKWIASVSISGNGAWENIQVMNVEDAIRSPETLTAIPLTSSGKDHDPQWQPVITPPTEEAALPSPIPTPTQPRAMRVLGAHQVRSGETIRCIASAYGVSASAIIELNRLGDPPQLHSGLLLIPDVKDEAGAGSRACSPQFASPYSLDPVVTVPAPTAFPFVLTSEGISARANSANAAGCDWMGIAGQAFARNGEPLAGLVVHLEGGGLSREALTGSMLAYGPGGYELQLSDHLAATTGVYRVQLRDVRGQPLSDRIPVDTFADCPRNLLVVNFVQK